MEINIIPFGEALEKLKKKEMPVLVRMKYLDADYSNRCVLLYNTQKYLSLDDNTLYQNVLTEEINKVRTCRAKLDSEDLLADDYLDVSDWNVLFYKSQYEKFLNSKIQMDKESPVNKEENSNE